MFLRVRHHKMVHVYLFVLVILGVLVVLGAMIAYHALLREQNFQIETAVSKLMNNDNQHFGKSINLSPLFIIILLYILVQYKLLFVCIFF